MAGERAVVTYAEMAAATDLVDDLNQPGLTRHGRIAMLAAALADAREGATIPGERHRVERTMQVRVWAGKGAPGRLGGLRERLRADWALGLERSGLRPLGWPPVTVTWLRWRAIDGTEQPPTFGDPYVECDKDQAELLRLSIRGLAVSQ